MSQDLHDEISDAIGAHGIWKMRLRDAAKKGERGLPVEDICRDDKCKFGIWLKTVPPFGASKDHLSKVSALHTAFHASAGEIAGMIRKGQDEAALAALETGTFRETSTKLVVALTHWRRAVEQ